MKPLVNNCELCIKEGIEEYETKYLDRELTASQCIERLQTKAYTWRNHINNHVKPQVALQLANRTELVDHVVDKVGETIRGLDDVKEVLSSMKQSILNSPDPQFLKTYLQALAELRHYVEALQKLQGDFQDTNKVNIQNMHVEYNNLVGHIMQDSCPKCKTKFAQTLKPVLENVSNEIRTDL
jgi:CO dehydrogenase/acetyl-CoA synthase gamma subunit (corrinoid Fe-S protein)